MQKRVNGLVLEVLKGDIVKQNDVTAIVNAANAQLKRGGGVAGAIHRAAGPGLEKECEPLAPISPGEAVITGGHNLPNKYVIHCLGPVYGRDKPESTILKKCYYNSLKLADEEGIDSIAFPAISTGAFGYPVRKAASIAFRAVKEVVPELKNIELIRFVLFSEKDYEVHKKALEENY